jgi:CO/xanthine dehydrogenase Mo-binding subunit
VHPQPADNPLGAKGAGEAGATASPPALINASSNAPERFPPEFDQNNQNND